MVQVLQLEVEDLVRVQVQGQGWEMVLDLVAAAVLGLAAGSVLGYWMALPRVLRLEKELAQALLQESDLGKG